MAVKSTCSAWGTLHNGNVFVVGRDAFGTRHVCVPEAVGVRAGQRLLAVRGSCTGLDFVAQGPIYEEALRHPELEQSGPAR
jgi:hypothetical protein